MLGGLGLALGGKWREMGGEGPCPGMDFSVLISDG